MSGRVKKMKVHLTLRHVNKGVTFGREFKACARLLKAGRGAVDGRQGAACAVEHSPRAAVASVLKSLSVRLSRGIRKGHKRYGGR
jgi:hypothetical protein